MVSIRMHGMIGRIEDGHGIGTSNDKVGDHLEEGRPSRVKDTLSHNSKDKFSYNSSGYQSTVLVH